MGGGGGVGVGKVGLVGAICVQLPGGGVEDTGVKKEKMYKFCILKRVNVSFFAFLSIPLEGLMTKRVWEVF